MEQFEKKKKFNSEADLGLSNFVWEIVPDHYILDILYSGVKLHTQNIWFEFSLIQNCSKRPSRLIIKMRKRTKRSQIIMILPK